MSSELKTFLFGTYLSGSQMTRISSTTGEVSLIVTSAPFSSSSYRV